MPHHPCMKVESAASFYLPKQVEVQARDRVLSIECCYQNDRHGVVQTAHMLNVTNWKHAKATRHRVRRLKASVRSHEGDLMISTAKLKVNSLSHRYVQHTCVVQTRCVVHIPRHDNEVCST